MPPAGGKRTHALVLAGYTAVSFGYFGARLPPHPGRGIIGSGRDSEIFVWAFAWWPHAIAHGQNPFVSHAVYAPSGINLAWTTSVPGLAIPFAPLTALVGPTASFNVAAILLPALAAWTAYLLCRHLTGSLWAGLVGGYLFGFSSYVLAAQLGHLFLVAVFLLPLVALVVIRHVEGAAGLPWKLGLLLGYQFWLSTEVAFTLVLALLGALVLAFALVRDARPRLRAIPRPLAGALAVGALATGPLGVYALLGVHTEALNTPQAFSADLVNFVVPTRLVGAGGGAFQHVSRSFPATLAEQGAYLGWPALVIVAWFAVRERRSGVARFLLAALVLAAAVSLGTSLRVEGHKVVTLPWDEVRRLPFFNSVLPVRFTVYAALACAVIVALWMRRAPRWATVGLPALAVVALVPAVWRIAYRDIPERWPFFTAGLYKSCIPRGENVAIFPYGAWGDSMLWQAESGFWFRMVGGYLRPKPPASVLREPTIRAITFSNANPRPGEILAMARRQDVGRILSVEIYAHPNGHEMHRFGVLQNVGGVLVAPACGYPPIATVRR